MNLYPPPEKFIFSNDWYVVEHPFFVFLVKTENDDFLELCKISGSKKSVYNSQLIIEACYAH